VAPSSVRMSLPSVMTSRLYWFSKNRGAGQAGGARSRSAPVKEIEPPAFNRIEDTSVPSSILINLINLVVGSRRSHTNGCAALKQNSFARNLSIKQTLGTFRQGKGSFVRLHPGPSSQHHESAILHP
jgi:hypothetical protein